MFTLFLCWAFYVDSIYRENFKLCFSFYNFWRHNNRKCPAYYVHKEIHANVVCRVLQNRRLKRAYFCGVVYLWTDRWLLLSRLIWCFIRPIFELYCWFASSKAIKVYRTQSCTSFTFKILVVQCAVTSFLRLKSWNGDILRN